MTPTEQDIKIFEIAGTLLFGSSKYTIGSAGANLEKLGLAPLRRTAWSTFFSAMVRWRRRSPTRASTAKVNAGPNCSDDHEARADARN
ncbi:hypothetical protein V8E36_007598 [Tilletia maclaganii]